MLLTIALCSRPASRRGKLLLLLERWNVGTVGRNRARSDITLRYRYWEGAGLAAPGDGNGDVTRLLRILACGIAAASRQTQEERTRYSTAYASMLGGVQYYYCVFVTPARAKGGRGEWRPGRSSERQL